MYYISNFESNCALSIVKKRLRDFKGIEGERYHVRTSKGLPRAVGRGLSRKSFCPWFVNRGAWCAAKGARFFAAWGARRGGGAIFSQNRDFGVACASFMCNDSTSTH
jgi:hypothetical protein